MKERELLAQNIKRYRLFRGLDQKDLAKETGLSSALISRLERGVENITIDNLIKIAKELDIPIEQLFMAKREIAIIPKEDLESLYRLAGISKKKIKTK